MLLLRFGSTRLNFNDMEKRIPSAALTEIMTALDESTLNQTRVRMFLACKIVDALEDRGISQDEFAKMLNKSESEISELLAGNKDFNAEVLSDIEKVINN